MLILEGSESIGKGSFEGLSEMKRISIPFRVNAIDANAFLNCAKLEQIEVSERNPRYVTEDGVLFDKEESTFIACYLSKSVS